MKRPAVSPGSRRKKRYHRRKHNDKCGGMRAVKCRSEDYVMALTVVLPSGEVVKLGSRTTKNNSGYSLRIL